MSVHMFKHTFYQGISKTNIQALVEEVNWQVIKQKIFYYNTSFDVA